MRINPKAVVDTLIADPTVNRSTNDYTARLRSFPGGPPSPAVAKQYGMDVREARKLVAKLDAMPKATRGAVLKELAKRATLEQADMPRFGGVKLSENAAKLLSEYAADAGVAVKFKNGQPRPIHPVG